MNLLDLRPGRASKGFLTAWIVLAAFAWGSAYVVLSLPVAAATLLWLAPDLGERGMLGDVGANLLGAVLGAGLHKVLGNYANTAVERRARHLTEDVGEGAIPTVKRRLGRALGRGRR